MRAPGVMVVNPSVPANTVSEFIAYAKANHGKINMATAGNGSPPHAYGELFKMMTGVDLALVAYRGGGPALVDLLGGHVQVMFESIASSIAYIRAGKLRALAVTTATRSAALPDIPTVAEFVPGYEASGWWGIGAPKNPPTQIIDRLNKEVNAALADPNIKERVADLGGVPIPMTPTEFSRLIADETEKWGEVIHGWVLRRLWLRLQQGFATHGMGSGRHFAWQQSPEPNVRFGSLANIAASPRNVRFAPKSGQRTCGALHIFRSVSRRHRIRPLRGGIVTRPGCRRP